MAHAMPPQRMILGQRRATVVASLLVLILTLTTLLASAFFTAREVRLRIEAGLQGQATDLARSIDLHLRTYKAALETIARSTVLLEEFDLAAVEREAQRVSALFGGWFVITAGGPVMQQLMNTRTPTGALAPPLPRTNYPELMRAEAESQRLGRSVISDAFRGGVSDELIVSALSAVEGRISPTPFIGFVVTLRDINGWLAETRLAEGHFAAIADGSRRVIARSQDSDLFALAALPDWYVAFSAGRDTGVAVGPPVSGGAPRLFAMQRLVTAPDWTLVVSRPVPSAVALIFQSPWPAVSALFALLTGTGIAWLVLDRRQVRIAGEQAARIAHEREGLLTEIRAADARKARLMAVLAHDLRTPLVAVLGALPVLGDPQARAGRADILDRLQRDGQGMLQLIDDVLELARLGTGELRLRLTPFDPAALIAEVADLIRDGANARNTQIRLEGEGLPVLSGDVAALRRVLMNFATNAVKATQDGVIGFSVHCGAAGPQGCPVTFSVTDTGRGIAATDIPRLFQDFGMLERNPTQELGTGLGLAICRRLAEAMGGTVGVDTTPGAGSSFWLRVTLPVARMPAPAGTQNSAPHTGAVPEVPSGALAGLRVLVAEDHDLIRQLTCINLTRWGAQAVEAADGHQAVAMAGVTSFDLILLDLRMPGLDGESAASAIRQGAGPSAQARILGLTADRIPATLAGVGADGLAGSALDGCLAKPLDLWQPIAMLGGVARPMSAPDPIQDFDNETVRHLRDLDGGTVLARTLEKFSAEIETARADLARHIAQGDLDSARQRAHGLAGLCDILGVFRLAEALRLLELIAASTTRSQTLHDALNELDIVLVLSREQADLLAGQARACAMGPEGSDAPPA